jgi:hypothetical protein
MLIKIHEIILIYIYIYMYLQLYQSRTITSYVSIVLRQKSVRNNPTFLIEVKYIILEVQRFLRLYRNTHKLLNFWTSSGKINWNLYLGIANISSPTHVLDLLIVKKNIFIWVRSCTCNHSLCRNFSATYITLMKKRL